MATFKIFKNEATNKTFMLWFHIVLLLLTAAIFITESVAFYKPEAHLVDHNVLYGASCIKLILYGLYVVMHTHRHFYIKHPHVDKIHSQ